MDNEGSHSSKNKGGTRRCGSHRQIGIPVAVLPEDLDPIPRVIRLRLRVPSPLLMAGLSVPTVGVVSPSSPVLVDGGAPGSSTLP